jgi:hypothetical protein
MPQGGSQQHPISIGMLTSKEMDTTGRQCEHY